MPKIVTLASLYEPLRFIENKVQNFNECNMEDVHVWFLDVSPSETYEKAKNIVLEKAKFKYTFSHAGKRETLYWAWNWIITQSKKDGLDPTYFCNTNVDDLLHPEYFQKMSKYLDNNRDKKIVCCNWWNHTDLELGSWPTKQDHASEVNPVQTLGHFPMWRSTLHDESSVGMFDPRMIVIGDSDFWTRIKKQYGMKSIGKIDEYLGGYLSHDNNLYYSGKGPNGISGEGWDRQIMKANAAKENSTKSFSAKRKKKG